MPSSIPYDHPSLALGNIVNTELLNTLQQIAALQAKTDATHDKLNSHISMRSSLAMTINELTSLGVDTKPISDKIESINTSITKAASDYMDIRLNNEKQILDLREQITEIEIEDQIESPVDFGSSEIKSLPLSSESLKLDVQYFSFENSNENDTDIMRGIESFIKDNTGDLGTKSNKLAQTTTSQIYRQQQNHNLSGTLIITASCTHKNIALIEPLVLDADKAVQAWNQANQKDLRLKAQKDSMSNIVLNNDSDGATTVNIVSGVAYGSSFVGMVHLLKKTSSATNPTPELIQELQEKMKIGGWLENASGGFGVDEKTADDIKNTLQAHNISSHVSLIVMGAVPSITSNKLMQGIKYLSDVETKKMSENLNKLSNSVKASINTLETGNTKATALKRLSQLINTKEESLLKGLGGIDKTANKVLDINSLMTAFENYIKNIQDKNKNVGTPIHFYLKKLTASQIAELWLEKYFPPKSKTKDSKK